MGVGQHGSSRDHWWVANGNGRGRGWGSLMLLLLLHWSEGSQQLLQTVGVGQQCRDCSLQVILACLDAVNTR